MAESFENLASILNDWAKDKSKNSIAEAMNRYENQSLAGKRKIRPFLSSKMAQKQFSNSP